MPKQYLSLAATQDVVTCQWVWHSQYLYYILIQVISQSEVIIKLEHDVLSGDLLSIHRPNMQIFGLNKLFDRKIVNTTRQRYTTDNIWTQDICSRKDGYDKLKDGQ